MKVIQGGLAFLLELTMLGALGYWGFTVGTSVLSRWALGLGAPVVAIAVWALFLAADGTNARVALPYWLVIALKAVVFAVASAALYEAAAPAAALVVAGLSAVSVAADAVRPLQR